MGSRYRRSSAPVGVDAVPDSSDPYTAYLSWVAEGRPALGGATTIGGVTALAAARPEEGTVLLSEHVQVQELTQSGAAGQPPTARTESLVPKESVWQRLTDRFRRHTLGS